MKRIVYVLPFALLVACDDAPETTKVLTVEEKNAPKTQTGPSGLQRLALEDPGGATAIDEQIRRLQGVAQRHEQKLDPWILLGRSWIQKARQQSDPGYYKNANACADIGFDILPDNALSRNLRGLVLMNDHRFADAKALMEDVLADDPDDFMALGTLSDALLELGDVQGATKHAQRMLDLKPSLPSYTRAAYLRWLTGDAKGATLILKKAIMAGGTARDKEAFAWVIVEAAKIFWHQGDHEGAEAGFDRALQAFPEYPPALVWKARVALARGEPNRALDLAERSYRGAALAETAWVWVDAARTAGDAAKVKEAEAKLEKLGEHGEARVLAAYLATENKDAKRAVALAERELKGRSDLYSHDAHAWALYRAGRFEEALAAAKRANAHGTPDASLRYHLGAIQIASGAVAEGRENVSAALALNPRFHPTAAAEARNLLAD
ncbi:MAG: tetratricopeptide repeat protein [Deltaproteobacteria bacterium]